MEATASTHNGQETPQRPAQEVRVRFGPGPTDTMPLEWAERYLQYQFEHQRSIFARTMTVGLWEAPAEAAPRRGRPPAGADQ